MYLCSEYNIYTIDRLMSDISKHTEPTQEQIESLQYTSKYIGLGPYIQKKFHSGNVVGYRMVHNPIIPEDSLPVAVTRPQRPSLEYTQEELKSMHESMTKGEKKETVADYGLSHFTTPWQCAQTLRKNTEKKDPIKAEEYKERFGTFIVRVNYTEKDGLVENRIDKKTGHFEFLPIKDFELTNYVDEDFGIQPYQNYLSDEQDK